MSRLHGMKFILALSLLKKVWLLGLTVFSILAVCTCQNNLDGFLYNWFSSKLL